MTPISSRSRSSPVNASVGILTDPQVTQLIDTLATNPEKPYPARSLDTVSQIIIHHSAVSNKIRPERLAKIQVAQGKSGIHCHLFIAGDGKIFQTNNLATVSAHTPGHDQNSIAVCFAGNFTRKAPNTSQIQAGKTIIQSLLEQFNIQLDNIKGASELVDTQSPGQQWLTGRNWKNRLVRGLTSSPPMPAIPEPGEAETPIPPAPPPQSEPDSDLANDRITELSQARADLRVAQNQISQLNRQINQLQSQVAQGQNLIAQITALNAQIAQLERDLAQAQDQAKLNKISADQTNTLNTQLTDLTAQLKKVQAQHNEAQTQITTLNTQLKQVRAQLSQANQKNAQIGILQQKIKQLETNLASATEQGRQASLFSEQIATLNGQVTDLSAQLTQSQTAQQKAETRADQLNEQLIQLRRQVSQSNQQDNQVTILNQQIDQLEADLAETKQQAEQSITLANQVTSLNTRLTQLGTQLNQSQSAQLAAEKRANLLNTQLDHLQKQFAEANEQAAKTILLNQQIDQLEADLATARAAAVQGASASDQVTALNGRVTELTNQLTQVQTAHQAEESRANALNDELKQIKAQLSKSGQQGTQIAILNQRIARLETELAAAKQQSAQDEAAADKVTTLNAHIAELTAKLAQAQSVQQHSDENIIQLNNEIGQLQTQLHQTQQDSAQVPTLRKRIAQLEADLRRNQAITSTEHNQQVTALNRQINELNQALDQARQHQQSAADDKAEIASLNTRIAQLEADLAEARQTATSSQPVNQTSVRPPKMQNVVDQLARHSQNTYPSRDEAEITLIVIHHTAVPASVSATRIAKLQVNQGKPAITYHYLIRGNGDILQTNLPTTQTTHTAGHDQHSLAVAFAGNFTDVIPTDQQLQAGARLLAYLKDSYSISQTSIKGASELANTQSPGRQWLQGKHWKKALLDKLNERTAENIALTPTASNGSPGPDLRNQITVLKARIAELETNLSIAQEAAMGQDGSIPRSPSMPAGSTIHQPQINDIVDDLPKHPTKRYQTRSIDSIKRIIVHHTAVAASISSERIANYNVNRNGWPGLGYHYVVTTEGIIEQTNDLTAISYHTGGQNNDSVGVAFAGDFDESVPNEAQITAGAHLIAWLLDSLNLPLANLRAHKNYANTTCPGNQWDSGAVWRETLLVMIQDNLAGAGSSGVHTDEKSLYHYLLFWQNENDWAKQDLISAGGYLSVFRPSLGFSVDDAMNAEYVTIVGGPLGVSTEAEAKIRTTGSKVERVAGNTEQATKALLDNLARQKKRFLFLNA